MNPGGKTVALIVAAGRGERAGGDLPKQYRRIGGKSVLAHAIDSLSPLVDEVRVVIGAGQEEGYRAAIGNRELPPPITGGATRRESVIAGLEAIDADLPRHAELVSASTVQQAASAQVQGDGPALVLIHDAARPFVPAAVVARLLDALATASAAVPVLPVVDTLAQGGETLGDTVPRKGLLRVQTPQAFRHELILAAHRAWEADREATDDAQIARAAGVEVVTVAGDRLLEKLTHPEDFAAAESRLASTMIVRTGLGVDVHAFCTGDRLWLGGVEIPHSHGLAGHSDADVALHALTDALLGAIGDGDIGDHFPPSDPRWRGASSARFLEHARDRIAGRGGIIDHVDVTIICEAPRIAPHRDAIRQRIAGLLQLPESRVSIKATTTERLGFTGRSEGIAAQAIATVRLGDEH